ncbi:glycosyltransferase family 4 protein [Motilibacter deserti]|uniref:Glycosyltransferase family 4 protein n=1 Tax=Motilibacter deserti TaxID=2714956 RepID=A0ABX0GUX4_9ACTN|nr:glycosyltransferase family 4 protein [Motilibacter deserti]NHC13445.1 glycosyltransferase family 4 protein [Motilibacter deserti]
MRSEPFAETEAPAFRVGYLVSQYPALSHAFIEREIRSLRALGTAVETFSVRPALEHQLLTATDREEAARTTVLLRVPRLARGALSVLARSPRAAAVGLIAALRLPGGTSPRALLLRVAYFAEACALLGELQSRSITHVHVHFANNAASVAHLAVRMGNCAGGLYSWSLTIHRPEAHGLGLEDDEARTAAALLRRQLTNVSRVVCISEGCRDQVVAGVGPDIAGRASVVHMGIDTGAYTPAQSCPESGTDGTTRVLFVGRLVPAKAPHDLLTAFAAARDRLPMRLVLVGEGQLLESLQRQAEQLGLADAVQFAGPVGQDELPGHYRRADVFCLPSYTEGVPVVLMEAMASGVPVLTTTAGAITELVRAEHNGLVVEPGDVDGIANGLRRLALDRELRDRLGQAGRATVVAEFESRVVASQLSEVFAAAVVPQAKAQAGRARR